MSDNNAARDWTKPWPIEDLMKRLRAENELYYLTQPRRVTRGHDVREYTLENIARYVMIQQFGEDHVIMRK